MRIVVTGLAATYPMGGVFWDYLQYPLGFHRLGHDVLYIEDTGQWCYDPEAGTYIEDGSRNARRLAQNIARLEPGLSRRWFFRDARGEGYGRSWKDVSRFCREADLFINLSAACWMRDEYFEAGCVAFIDSDPMYTQASLPGFAAGTLDEAERQRVELLLAHDVFFTFAGNTGQPECLVPNEIVKWLPTRQPIVIEEFAGASVDVLKRRRVLTTVASWEPTVRGSLIVNGRKYRGKSAEFERFAALPALSPLPCEVALSGDFPCEDLRRQGWKLVDPLPVSSDPWVYRDYLANSFAEWSVAKNAYVASRSGWFSCRTACYLALGVPAIVQDTGFSASIPVGEGLLCFNDLPQAVESIYRVIRDPERHVRAARVVANEYFRSDLVLKRLIEDCFDSDSRDQMNSTRSMPCA